MCGTDSIKSQLVIVEKSYNRCSISRVERIDYGILDSAVRITIDSFLLGRRLQGATRDGKLAVVSCLKRRIRNVNENY